MKRLSLLTLACLLALSLSLASGTGPAHARLSQGTDTGFFFIQMADPQFGMWALNKDTVKEEETFRKAVDHINRLKPAFVIISGDLINTPHDPEQTRVFWSLASKIRPEVPLYLVPGNHDVGSGKLDRGIAAYRRDFGADRYAFSHGGSRFIVLNSNVITNAKDNPALEREQRWWFRAQLEAARAGRADHIVVCTHHPWFLETPDEKDQYFNVPLAQRAWYLDRMRQNGVALALAGHLHREASGSDGSLRMVTTGPVGQPLGKDPSGFRIVRVTKDRVESRYYGLDEVPDRVTP